MAEGRYVDRDQIRAAKMTIVSTSQERYMNGLIDGWNKCCEALAEQLPGVDIPESRIATWEISSDGYYPYCSSCHYEPKPGQRLTKFCPECGARMTRNEA